MSHLISPDELAEKFGGGVTRRRVIEWTNKYKWPHVGIGRFIGYTPDHVAQILAAQTVSAPTTPALPRFTGQTEGSKRRAS